MKDQRPDGRDVERIRTLLNEAAPQDTRASFRAQSVVRRARGARTRNGVVSALAVGVAAAAVIIGPSLIDSSTVTNEANDLSNGVASTPTDTAATDTPTDTPPTDTAAGSDPDPYANPCPDSPVEVSDSPDAGTLGPDATMVRLCRASVAGVTSAWEPPADALVIGVDDFAAQVAELPDHGTNPDPCPTARVAPQPFVLRITDSAGATQTLGSALTMCGVVTIDSKLISAEALLDAFRQALTEQRATLKPEVADMTLECRGGDSDEQVRPGWMADVTAQTRFIGAVTCSSEDSQEPTPAPALAIELLNQEWAATARHLRDVKPLHVDRCPAMDYGSLPSYLMTTWGDVVRMRMAACGEYRTGHFQLIPSERLMKEMSLLYQPELNWSVPGD